MQGVLVSPYFKTKIYKSSKTNCQVQQKPVRLHAIVILNITTINISLHSSLKCMVAAQIHTQTPSHLAANGGILSKKEKLVFPMPPSESILEHTHENQQMLGRISGTLKIGCENKEQPEGYEILLQRWLIACQFIAKKKEKKKRRASFWSLTYCGKCMPFCFSQGEQLHNAITLDQSKYLHNKIHREHLVYKYIHHYLKFWVCLYLIKEHLLPKHYQG